MIDMGAHTGIPVYAQRHAYLTNKLAGFFRGLTELDASLDGPEDLVPLLGDQAYDLLTVVVPTYTKRCPKYEFCGYGSQEAYDLREYDESEDQSPDFPQILNAFEVSAEVNRFDVLKTIAKVVDPKLLKQWINTQLAIAISKGSPSLLAPTGGSQTSMDFGTTPPTSSEIAD